MFFPFLFFLFPQLQFFHWISKVCGWYVFLWVVDNVITLGLWWLGLVCRLWERVSRIRNLCNNFLLHIHVVQFLFYILCLTHSIFLSLTFYFSYIWHLFNSILKKKKQKQKKPRFNVFTFDNFETIIEYMLNYTPTNAFIFFDSMVLFCCVTFLNFCLASTNIMFSKLFLIMCNT